MHRISFMFNLIISLDKNIDNIKRCKIKMYYFVVINT